MIVISYPTIIHEVGNNGYGGLREGACTYDVCKGGGGTPIGESRSLVREVA